MKTISTIVSVCAFFLMMASAAHAHEVCTKDGKPLEVAGKDHKEKKADCQAKGGTWSKGKGETEKGRAGGGGGW